MKDSYGIGMYSACSWKVSSNLLYPFEVAGGEGIEMNGGDARGEVAAPIAEERRWEVRREYSEITSV